MDLHFRFHFCFAALFVVGVGSWMFHMTLQYEMQLLDELPMVWGGCVLAYCMYQVQSPVKQENTWLALILTSLAILFTLTHIHLKIPVVHFVLLSLLIVRWRHC